MGKRPKSFCMGTKKEDVAERMTTTGTESKRIARSIKAQPVNSNLPFSTYEKTAAHLQMQIAIYRDESNWKQVYRLGLALGSLVQETMKKHAEWREKEKRFERWTKEAEAVLGELEILKEEINWCAKRKSCGFRFGARCITTVYTRSVRVSFIILADRSDRFRAQTDIIKKRQRKRRGRVRPSCVL